MRFCRSLCPIEWGGCSKVFYDVLRYLFSARLRVDLSGDFLSLDKWDWGDSCVYMYVCLLFWCRWWSTLFGHQVQNRWQADELGSHMKVIHWTYRNMSEIDVCDYSCIVWLHMLSTWHWVYSVHQPWPIWPSVPFQFLLLSNSPRLLILLRLRSYIGYLNTLRHRT